MKGTDKKKTFKILKNIRELFLLEDKRNERQDYPGIDS